MMKCKLLLLLSALFVAISIYNDRALDNSFAHTDEILEQLNLKMDSSPFSLGEIKW